jgi:hypothetical protein
VSENDQPTSAPAEPDAVGTPRATAPPPRPLPVTPAEARELARQAYLARQQRVRPSGPPRDLGKASGFCVTHRDVAATRLCWRCRAPMCDTCDFAFPDGSHICPACVANPTTPVSSKRTGMAIGGLAMAGLATAVLGSIMSGIWKLTEAEAGGIFTVLVLLPCVAGVVLSCSAMSKRLGNNALLWTSTLWNAILGAILLILIIIGNLK